MTWWVNGTDATIGFDGDVPFVSGNQVYTNPDYLFIRQRLEKLIEYRFANLDKVKICWEIHPNNYKPLRISFLNNMVDVKKWDKIKQTVKKEPDNIHYNIGFKRKDHDEPLEVSFLILIPKQLFETQFLMWKDFVFGNKTDPLHQIKYTIVLETDDFLNLKTESKVEKFRNENPQYRDAPTFEEWINKYNTKLLLGKDGFKLSFSM